MSMVKGIIPEVIATLVFFALCVTVIVLLLDWFLYTETGFAVRGNRG